MAAKTGFTAEILENLQNYKVLFLKVHRTAWNNCKSTIHQYFPKILPFKGIKTEYLFEMQLLNIRR